MNLRSHYHLRHAIPRVHLLSFIIETNQPRIRPGAKGKHGKSITKSVLSHLKLEVIRGPSPDELLIVIAQRDSVVALHDRLAKFDDKVHGDWSEARKDVGVVARMVGNLPAKEAALASRAANLRMAVGVAPRTCEWPLESPRAMADS